MSRPSTLVVLVSAVHPDELPAATRDDVADAVIWKSDLQPRLLGEIWLRHRQRPSNSGPTRSGP